MGVRGPAREYGWFRLRFVLELLVLITGLRRGWGSVYRLIRCPVALQNQIVQKLSVKVHRAIGHSRVPPELAVPTPVRPPTRLRFVYGLSTVCQ